MHAPLRRRTLLAAAAVAPTLVAAQSAATVPPEIAALVPDARLQGSGRLRFIGLHVYDARLWVAEGFSGSRFDRHAFALEIEYARTLYGKAIAERSLEEMRRAGSIDDTEAQRWLEAMQRLFPDVAKGDRITGVHRPGEAARFFHNGQPRGDVRDAEFARRFFGIWLAPHTSEPGLRESLLGPTAART